MGRGSVNMNDDARLWIDRTGTPIGEMIVVVDHEGRLHAIDWTDHEQGLMRALRRRHGERGFALESKRDPHGVTSVMNAYFEGDLAAIDGLPVDTGGTSFQQSVWRALREIPCGTTISYGELARRIGQPTAVRAVGLANGANPIGVVVPCHRVVGSDGKLTGYGGGLDRKRWLLRHEGSACLSFM
jgi:methylated-DNA-[protein]-cysteine S-methyltransferase